MFYFILFHGSLAVHFIFSSYSFSFSTALLLLEPLKFVFAFVYHRWTWTRCWTVFVFALWAWIRRSEFGVRLTPTTHVECDVICVAILLLMPLEGDASPAAATATAVPCGSLRLSHHSPGGNNNSNTEHESMRTT